MSSLVDQLNRADSGAERPSAPSSFAPKATRDREEQLSNLRTAAALNAVQTAMRHAGRDIWTERDVQTSRIIAAALHNAASANGEGVAPAGARPVEDGLTAYSAIERALTGESPVEQEQGHEQSTG